MDLGTPTAGHFIYIPVVLLLGVVVLAFAVPVTVIGVGAIGRLRSLSQTEQLPHHERNLVLRSVPIAGH